MKAFFTIISNRLWPSIPAGYSLSPSAIDVNFFLMSSVCIFDNKDIIGPKVGRDAKSSEVQLLSNLDKNYLIISRIPSLKFSSTYFPSLRHSVAISWLTLLTTIGETKWWLSLSTLTAIFRWIRFSSRMHSCVNWPFRQVPSPIN